MRNYLLAALMGASILVPLAGGAAAEPADTVLRGGLIHTMNDHDTVASAVAVKGGRIVYVGDDKGATAFVGPETRTIDLHGRMVMPGLIDGHMHPLDGGSQLLGCNLEYSRLTVPAFQARIQKCLDETKSKEPDRWLVVFNWFQQDMQPPGVDMTKAMLDGLQTTRPIAVESSFGHSTLANSRALALAKITAATPDPISGQIHHDASGAPTGLLEDSAQALVQDLIPPATPEENVAAARAALAAMAEQGVTGFLDAVARPEDLAAFSALSKIGALTARAHFAPLLEPKDGAHPDEALGRIAALVHTYDEGALKSQPTITVRNVKLFMDGVITAPAFTGVMIDPYFQNFGTDAKPDWRAGTNKGPQPYFPPQVLGPILIKLAAMGLDAHMHADGDGAVRIALDAVEQERKASPNADFRPAIAHDEIVDPSDYPRYKALNTIPVLSLQWGKEAPDTIESAKDFLGPQRFKALEPSGALEAAGARIAYGSDWPVDPLNEWFALKVGVTRTNAPEAGAQYAHPLSDGLTLSLPSTLRAITRNSAYELREEEVAGSLEVGKFADLIVLDQNLFAIAPADIAKTKVLLTMVGGKTVYQSGAW